MSELNTVAVSADAPVPDDAAFRMQAGNGWWYYTESGRSQLMEDAKWRSRHATDDQVKIESRWASDRTKWQPYGYWHQGLWSGAGA